MMIDEEFSYNYGVTSDSAWCSGVASITPAKEYFDSFPFPCTLKLTYTLSAEGLRLDYKVTNDGEETLPYGFAIHPYFDKMGDPDSITITVPADQLYEAFEMLPTGNLLPVEGDFDLRPAAKEKKKGLFAKEEEGLAFSEHKVSQAFIDHVYTGLDSSKQALIHYEKLGLTLALRASDEFKNMVVYTPANRPGFCLENQTNATDFINLHEQGIETANLLELPAGQTRGGFIELTGCAQRLPYAGPLTGSVIVGIRPEQVQYAAAGEGELTGTVRTHFYLGDVDDCRVELGEGCELRVIADPYMSMGVAAGKQVTLKVRSFHAFPKDKAGDFRKILT